MAGLCKIRSGSVKTLKQSARSSLVVMEGSKIISPSSSLASEFFLLRLLVKDRLSCGSPSGSRWNLGGMLLSLMSASSAHQCGFSQPLIRSRTQSSHMHWGVFSWISLRCMFRTRADVFSRSSIVSILCTLSRHLAALVVSGWCCDWRRCQVGSFFRRSGSSLIAARCMLYFCAVVSMLMISTPSITARLPWRGASSFVGSSCSAFQV